MTKKVTFDKLQGCGLTIYIKRKRAVVNLNVSDCVFKNVNNAIDFQAYDSSSSQITIENSSFINNSDPFGAISVILKTPSLVTLNVKQSSFVSNTTEQVTFSVRMSHNVYFL